MKKRIFAILLACSVLFSILPDAAFAAEEIPAPVSSGLITAISLPETAVISVRSVKTLTLTMTPNLADPNCEWSSSDSSIVTVCGIEGGAAGIITGISVGSATITARTEDGLEAACVVTVEDAPVPTALELEESYTVQVGRVAYIHPGIMPEDATALFSITTADQELLDTAVVQDGSYIAVRGLKPGTAKIYVETDTGLRAESTVYIEEDGIDSDPAKEHGLLAYVSPDNMENSLTRSDLAGLAAAFAGLELDYTDADALSYTDCDLLPDIQKAVIAGTVGADLMGGTSSDTFGPHSTVTRAQLAAVIWRCLEEPKTDHAFGFEDAPVSTWYYEPITSLHNLGILAATGSLICPNDTVTLEEALSCFSAARIYEVETGHYSPSSDFTLHSESVRYIFWDCPDDKQTYIKMQFSPTETGWYEVISSGSQAIIDFYETENIEVVTDTWASEYGPFGTYAMKAQLYKGETYTISIHPHYFDEGGMALSLRGPIKSLPTVSMSFEQDEKQLYVGEEWTPVIQISPEEALVQDTNWWCTDYQVVRCVKGESGIRDTLLAVGEGTAVVNVTSYLVDDSGSYCGYLKASCEITVTKPQAESSAGGGSGSGSSSTNITTITTKNEDGSTTTTVTDKITGAVTETTENADGSTLVVVTAKDGTVEATETRADGVKVKTVHGPDGDVTATVTIPQSVGKTNVTVPADVDYSMVAVNADTGGIVRLSVPTEDGMIVKLDGNTELVILDRAGDFDDTVGHWAADAISFVSAHELFEGTGAAAFSPDDLMTRAMFMTVLARFDGQDTSGGATWYEKGMEWAMSSGVSDGSDPHGVITREQLAAMLWRYAGRPAASSSLAGFSDAGSVSGYAVDAMTWAVETGILNGMGDSALAPQGCATRAQAAAILMRFTENLVK